MSANAFARRYFVLQGLAGGLWWAGAFLSPPLREATLGHLPLELAWLDVPLFALASLLAALPPLPSGGEGLGVRGSSAIVVLVWTALVAAGMFVYATLTREAAWGMLLMAAALGGTALAASELLLGHVPTEWLVQGPFVFRTTPDAERHLARTLRQLVAFWGFFLVVLPFAVASLERRWRLDVPFPLPARIVGGAALLLASGLGVWSAVTMSRLGEGSPLPATMAKRLVVAGPYRYVRNPMAVAGIGQGAMVGLVVGSWLVVLYALVGSAIWNWAVRPHEEADLAARFGEAFEAYRARVRCWWPTFPTGSPD